MKYLKLYENKWSENELKKFSEEKHEVYDLLKEFMIEENFTENFDSILNFYFASIGSSDEIVVVRFLSNIGKGGDKYHEDVIGITGQDLNNFYQFMNDPELYRSSKKYNL